MKKLIFILLLMVSLNVKSDIVIINNAVNNQKKLYRYEIQSIFLLRTNYWNNGTPIIPIYLSFDDPIHLDFVTHVLHVTEYNFNILVSNKIEQGETKHVITVANINEAIETVKKINGSIAYIKDNNAIIPYKNEIKIINIVD